MEIGLGFVALHITALILMSWFKSNNIIGGYINAALLWGFLIIAFRVWLPKIIAIAS